MSTYDVLARQAKVFIVERFIAMHLTNDKCKYTIHHRTGIIDGK